MRSIIKKIEGAPLQRLKSTALILTACFLSSHSFSAWSQASFAEDQLLYSGSATTVQWGDFDNDGIEDLFIAEGGKHSSGNSVLSWFKAPQTAGGAWLEYAIGPDLTRFTGDSDAVDVDKDGFIDIVVARDDHADLNPAGSMQWYKNPGNLDTNPNQNWQKFIIEANVPDAFHQGDLETADVDNDGKLDIVVRSLGINRFVIYFQNSASDWDAVRINSPFPREGMVIADLDQDNKVDIIGNGFILFAPANPRECTIEGPNRCMATDLWEQKTFDANFYNASQSGLNNSTKGEVYDMDGDGLLDILQSSAEGNDVYLAWYKNPSNTRTGTWLRRTIESPQGRNHNVQTGDVDLDGDVDVLGGFSFGSRKVVWWENLNGDALTWARREIDGSNGCYSCVASDFDNDGDIDFAGPTRYAREVYLYRNTTADGSNVLSVSPNNVTFSAASDSASLSISSRNASNNSDVAWTASSNQAWLSLNAPSGTGNSTLVATATAHTGFGNRTAVISISNGSIVRTVAVSQLGMADTQAPTVPSNVQSSSISFDSFSLSWNASNDNSAQTIQYRVSLNGVEASRTENNAITLTGLTEQTIFSVQVSAIDTSGNESAASNSLSVTTEARPPSPPPYAHWRFDETSGLNASDSSSRANNGILSGGMSANQWSSSGLIGSGALNFEGGPQLVDLNSLDAPTNAITMIAWLRPTDITSNNGEGRIISKASGTSANQHIWMLSSDENSGAVVPRVRINTNGSTTTLLGRPDAPIANNQWAQIVASYDGAIIRLYLNGDEVGSSAASGLIGQGSSVPASIGNQPDGSRGFVGLLDDVCIFDYAITEQDVGFLYNSGNGRACDTLVSGSNPDITPPSLSEVTSVPTPSTENSPGYVFSTSEAGTVSFTGSCFDGSDTGFDVSAGEIIYGFSDLAPGTYADCTITVTDAAGNASNPLAISSFTIIVPDTTKPTVVIDQASNQADPTSSNLARFVVTFSEAIALDTFNASDITVSGTNGTISQGPSAQTNANRVFSFSITGMSDGDTVTVSINANVVEDLAGNSNEASSSSDNQVSYQCNNCTIEDQDNDGVSDSEDNCPNNANPDQLDSDQDGTGDACMNEELCFPIKTRTGPVALICL